MTHGSSVLVATGDVTKLEIMIQVDLMVSCVVGSYFVRT